MGSISLGMMMGGAASGFTAGFEIAQKAKEREEKRKAEKNKRLLEQQKYQTEQDQYKAEAFGSASKEIKTMQDKYLEQKEKIMGSDSKLSNKDKIKAMNALDKSYQEASSNTIKTLQAKKAWSPEIENQRLALETGEYGYYDNNGVEMYGSKGLTDAIATEGDNAWVEKDGTVKRWNYTGEEKKEEVLGRLNNFYKDSDKDKGQLVNVYDPQGNLVKSGNIKESEQQEYTDNGYRVEKQTASNTGNGKNDDAKTSGLAKGGQWVTHPDYDKPIYRSNTEIRQDDRYIPVEKPKDIDIGDIKLKQYDTYRNTMATSGKEPLEFTAWDTMIQQKAYSKVIVDTKKYSETIKPDGSNYDADTALELESQIYGTKAFTTKLSEQKDELERGIILEQGLDELGARFRESIEKGEYKSGLLSTTKKKIAEYTGSDSAWTKFTNLSPEEMATSLGLETSMGDTVARYVKLISGAAATDPERATLMNIMFGSEYKDETVRLTKFEQFIKDRKRDNKNLANSIKDRLPYSAGKYLYREKKKKEDEATKPSWKKYLNK